MSLFGVGEWGRTFPLFLPFIMAFLVLLIIAAMNYNV